MMEKKDWRLARLASPAYIQAFIDRVNAALQSDDLDPDKSDFQRHPPPQFRKYSTIQ